MTTTNEDQRFTFFAVNELTFVPMSVTLEGDWKKFSIPGTSLCSLLHKLSEWLFSKF